MDIRTFLIFLGTTVIFSGTARADFATPFVEIHNKVGDISEGCGYVAALDQNVGECKRFHVIVRTDTMREVRINATAKKNVVTETFVGRPVNIKAKVVKRNENRKRKKVEVELEILSLSPIERQEGDYEVWSARDLQKWYMSLKQQNPHTGPLVYRGTDTTYHYYICRSTERYVSMRVKKEEIRLDGVEPAVYVGMPWPGYYAVDPNNGYKRMDEVKVK